jgi:Glutathione S-transferase, C-terminal domain
VTFGNTLQPEVPVKMQTTMTTPSADDCDNGCWFKCNSDAIITVILNEEATATPRFGTAYWSIRGLGAPLRMMLCAAKQNFTIYMYDFVEDGETGWKSNYYPEKSNSLLPTYTPFMNLPCIIDEEEKIVLTQLNACMHYVGNILGMFGETLLEQSTCLQFLCELYDLRCAMTDFVYGVSGTTESTMEKCRCHMGKFDRHLQNKEKKCFTVGDSLTAPDFHLFEMVDQFDHFFKANGSEDLLLEFPNVGAFFSEFSQLEYVLKQRQ